MEHLLSKQSPAEGPVKNEAPAVNLWRADSLASDIIIAAEVARQRYKRLQPNDALDTDKDYKTIVHTITPEDLTRILRTRMSPDGKCDKGPAGLREDQARNYFQAYGENRITPAKSENMWLKLARLTFCGIFNILLWLCVIAEVVLIVIFSGQSEKDADYVTPSFLSFVIVMAALLQWWSELKAENQMESMQSYSHQAK